MSDAFLRLIHHKQFFDGHLTTEQYISPECNKWYAHIKCYRLYNNCSGTLLQTGETPIFIIREQEFEKVLVSLSENLLRVPHYNFLKRMLSNHVCR